MGAGAKRLLIAGGGTGGHLFPALAVAEAWDDHPDGGEILFVGTQEGLESRILPREGRHLATLKVGRLKGGGWIKRLRTLLGLPLALLSALGIVRGFKPDVVLGVGGYASAPALFAAWLLRIPVALHEQNARPGLANRTLGRLARLAMVSFKETETGWFRCPATWVGNPVRAALVKAAREERGEGGEGFGLLIFGGSQGARVFSQVAPPALAGLDEKIRQGLRLRHQAPTDDVDGLKAAYAAAGIKAEVLPFIHDMAGAYREADLVICRAGATSLAELAVVGKPALLVPFPHAADDHQTANAWAVVAAGAGWLQPQAELTPEWLRGFLLERMGDAAGLGRAGEMAKALGRPGAAGEIVSHLMTLAG